MDGMGMDERPTAQGRGAAEGNIGTGELAAGIPAAPAPDSLSAAASAQLSEAASKRSSRLSGGSQQLTPEQERMVIEHLPMVRYLAQKIHERLPQQVELDDLISAGVLGLIDAFHKFDPSKNIQFRSYAQFRVSGAILDSLRQLDWSPRALRRKSRTIEEAIHTLAARLGRSPDEAEVAREVGLDLTAYQQLLGEIKGLEIGTLHIESSEDGDEEKLAYIPSRPEDDPLFICLKSEMRARLAAAIDQLPERERLVMTLYHYEEMTMKEIGLTLGVGESRVSQMRTSAVLHLRAALTGGRTAASAGRPADTRQSAGGGRRMPYAGHRSSETEG